MTERVSLTAAERKRRSRSGLAGAGQARGPVTSFRVTGTGCRSVGTFSSRAELSLWQDRLVRAVRAGAAWPERFVIVAVDSAGVELRRDEWHVGKAAA